MMQQLNNFALKDRKKGGGGNKIGSRDKKN